MSDMKVLYYSVPHGEQESGGTVIRKRNLAFLRDLVGEDNAIFHHLSEFTWRLKITRIIQELTGAELFVDKKLLEELENVDFVFIDGTNRGTFSTSALRKTRVISFFHNVEYDYLCQEMTNHCGIMSMLKNIILKPVVYYFERRVCRYSDTVITLNQRDSDRLKQLYSRKSDLILPTSMEDSYEEAEPDDSPPYLLFIGSAFFGNTDGLFWFCEHCMPKIKAPLIVAGKGMEKYKDKYPSDRIRVYGYVDDLAQLYRNAAAVVSPIISGSGMKTKTCEAMMYGKVIFGTPESFEGYLLSNDCIVCESDTEFVEAINAYLDRGDRYFSRENRELFLRNYESSVVARKFKDFFDGKQDG